MTRKAKKQVRAKAAKKAPGRAKPRSRKARAPREARLEPAMLRRALDAIHRVMREAEESDDESLAEVVAQAIRERDERLAELQEEVAALSRTANDLNTGCVELEKEHARFKAAVENVRALVARESARTKVQTIAADVAGHLLRLCAEAGVKGSILRGAETEPLCDCPTPAPGPDGVCRDCCGRVPGEGAQKEMRT